MFHREDEFQICDFGYNLNESNIKSCFDIIDGDLYQHQYVKKRQQELEIEKSRLIELIGIQEFSTANDYY